MHSFIPGSVALVALTTPVLAPNIGSSKSTLTASETATRHAMEHKSIVDTAVGAGSFKTLVKALESAKLVDTFKGPGPFTVFAPSDEAFAKLPAGTLENLLKPENAATLKSILTFHVVAADVRAEKVAGLKFAVSLNGQRIAVDAGKDGVRVAGARVVKTDIACSNGVIHVIDQVMMPATKNIVATAVDAGQFKILAKALGAAGLVDALSGQGPFTVFAPTDEAFAELPKGALDDLLKPENKEKLVAILKYHVTTGRVYADQLSAMSLTTLGTEKLPIEVSASGPRVGGAGVLKADLETTNGVIHVIDRVLIPSS